MTLTDQLMTKLAAAEKEAVDHPSHYGGDVTYETIKVLRAWLTADQYAGFCLGNSIKYMSRAGKKDGSSIAEDVAKAEWYAAELQRFLKEIKA